MLAIIGGSGLADFAELQVNEVKTVNTSFGEPSSVITVGQLGERQVAFLARHGSPHVIPPHCVNYRANLWALKELGVTEIVAVNAVGGISEGQDAEVISLPDQIIDYTYGRQHTYSDSAEVPLDHIDFSFPYSQGMCDKLSQAAVNIELPIVAGGVYAATQGPRLETAAEIRRLANDGCDIVGMTGMPEAGLARELGVEYACIALVVNKAAGCSDELITMAEIEKVMSLGMQNVKKLISAYCAM